MSRTYAVYGVALVLGVLYGLSLPLQPYAFSWLLKLLPMLIFAGLFYLLFPGWAGRWLALGYIGAAAGDFFLDFGQRDGLFVQALLSFLVNQLAFVVAFTLLARGQRWSLLRSLPALLGSLLVGLWLVPQSAGLQIPVLIYLLCLLAMVLCAVRLAAGFGPLWWGAMLFLLADSLIGVNKFAWPFAHSTEIIVTFYFSGQALIAWGLLRLKASQTTVATASAQPAVA